MAAHRSFLLALLVATFTGIVVIQISLDGWTLRGSVQYSVVVGKKDHEKTILKLPLTKNYTMKTDEPMNTSKQFSFRITPSQISTNKSSMQQQLSALQNLKSIATAQRVQARVRIRAPQRIFQSGNADSVNRHLMLISPQARLQEILQHTRTIKERQLDFTKRFLDSLPIVNPKVVTRVIILTYFRSGSTFLGDILQQNWKTFYHFEPLHFMTYDSRIPDNKVPEAFNLLQHIFMCNFTSMGNYIEWVKKPNNQFLFAHNLFLWFSCRTNPRICFSPNFLSSVCERSPFQVMKITRLHMRQLKDFFQLNPDLNIKVIYLARDPRGIISSRWTMDWCNETQCSDPHALCGEMKEDVTIFKELQQKYPFSFIQLRYEDLSLYPDQEVENLLKFLGLPYSATVKRFLKTHTIARKIDNLDPYSTRRNSSSMAFSWKQRLNFTQVNNIQTSCTDVIGMLNYSRILSPGELMPQNKTKIPSISPHLMKRSHPAFS